METLYRIPRTNIQDFNDQQLAERLYLSQLGVIELGPNATAKAAQLFDALSTQAVQQSAVELTTTL